MKIAILFNQSSGLSTYKDIAYTYDDELMLLLISLKNKTTLAIYHFVVDKSGCSDCNISGKGFMPDPYMNHMYKYVDVEIRDE